MCGQQVPHPQSSTMTCLRPALYTHRLSSTTWPISYSPYAMGSSLAPQSLDSCHGRTPSKPLQCTCGVSGPGVRRDYTWSCAVSWSLNTGGFSFHPCSLRVSELHGHMTVHHMCSSACTHRFFWNLGCEYLQKPSLRQVMSMISGESGRECLT